MTLPADQLRDVIDKALRLLDVIAIEGDAEVRAAALDEIGVRLGQYIGPTYAEADMQRAMRELIRSKTTR